MKLVLRFSNSLVALLAAVFWLVLQVPNSEARESSESSPAVELRRILTLDPARDLAQIADSTKQLAARSKANAKEMKAAKREHKSELANLPYDDLKKYFHDSPDRLTQREIRGLEEAARLASAALTSAQSNQGRTISDLREVLAGLRNSRRSPIPATTGALSPWRLLIRNSNRSIGIGKIPASNLDSAANDDSGKLDPKPSGFWHRPSDIASLNLSGGFGRASVPKFNDVVWKYDEPKTGSGTRPGFVIKANGCEYKIKLAEANSEPFTARIFDALGYHVDPTDFAAELKIQYDRRLFREFNLRQTLPMRLRPFGIPLGSLELQPYHDPFQFINTAIFKDGHGVSGQELKILLLIDPHRARAEQDSNNYRTNVEAQLDYVVVGPANVQLEKEPLKSIGCWDFTGLGHEHLRELRGAGLLAAWLGWFDSRFDNTRLRAAKSGDSTELQFFFTDLGSGMGGGGGWLIRHGEDSNAFEWTFTRPEIVRGPGRMTTPFRITNFKTIVPTPAFQNMTIGDARWMARLIAQLTKAQLMDALTVSGYSPGETKLYLEKLLSRRDQMLRDLGLADEFPPLNSQKVDRKISSR